MKDVDNGDNGSLSHTLSTSTCNNSFYSSQVTMSDDFVRLVSQANPASRQYQPANNGYPPSSSFSAHIHSPSGQVLDPFFDDDDDIPDSAFGRPIPMQSKESGLPLAHAGAAPAGNSQISLPLSVAPDWSFDDTETPQSKTSPFTSSSTYPAASTMHSKKPSMSSRKRWKWPWQKHDRVLTGERIIALNSPEANHDFSTNHVSTSKYNSLTFLPKFFLGPSFCLLSEHGSHCGVEQFSKYANVFFLFTALIQQIPGVSPTNRYTTIAPLAVVLLASAFKEMQEDVVSNPRQSKRTFLPSSWNFYSHVFH